MPNENIKKLAYKDYLNGMKYKDIATKHNLKVSTVKSWAVRYWKKSESEKVATNTKKVATKHKNFATPKLSRLQPEISKNNSNALATALIDSAMDDKNELTAQQQRFCLYYATSDNALQSYLKAYNCSYLSACGSAYRLLENAKIKQKIDELKQIMRQHININADDMIIFLSKVVKSDIRDYLKFGRKSLELSDGRVIEVNFVDLEDSETVDTSLIQEIKQGKDGVSLKMIDKRWAWEKLEKLLGWSKEQSNENDVYIIDDIPTEDDDEECSQVK